MSRRLGLLPADWPAADRAMWAAITFRGGPLDDMGPLAHLRASSIRTLEISYGRWLGWLSTMDPPGALAEPPAARATAPLLSAWMRDLAALSPTSRLTFAEQTIRILSAWSPEADWASQRRLLSLLRCEVADTPSTRKDGRILSSADLLDLGLRLADGGDAIGPTQKLAEAKRRRDGVMIAFLALLPLRRRSFCALELGRSVIVRPGGVSIHLDGDDTKPGSPWEAPLPAALDAPVRHYIAEVRPWLMERSGENHAHLWVNDSGRPYSDLHLGDRITRITERHLGVRVPPHLFRDAAATTLAHHSPDAARLTRAILAHSSFRTAEKHYNHARTIDAGRRYFALIETLKGPA